MSFLLYFIVKLILSRKGLRLIPITHSILIQKQINHEDCRIKQLQSHTRRILTAY